MELKLKYYHNLDGLRGIAALMVVVFHFFIFPNTSYLIHLNTYRKMTEFGQHGVSLFFVLSGFVITRILINSRNNNNYFQSFYLRRVLRILPLYYLFLFVYYISIPLLAEERRAEFILQLPYYFYIQNFTEVLNIKASGPDHYWSLAVEEHFYLLWPLAVYLVRPKNLWKLIGVIIMLIFILKYFMLRQGLSINKFTFTRIDQILMGAYLAVLEWSAFFKKKKSLNIMLLIGLSVLPLAVSVYLLSGQIHFIKEISKYYLLGMFFFGLIGYLLFLDDKHFINRLLSVKLLQYLGKISYGIYIWHFLALYILNRLFISGSWILDLVMTIGLTILLAHISFFYFEKRFLQIYPKRKVP